MLFGQSSAVIYGLNKGLAKSNAVTLESDWSLSGKVSVYFILISGNSDFDTYG